MGKLWILDAAHCLQVELTISFPFHKNSEARKQFFLVLSNRVIVKGMPREQDVFYFGESYERQKVWPLAILLLC